MLEGLTYSAYPYATNIANFHLKLKLIVKTNCGVFIVGSGTYFYYDANAIY